MKTVDLYRRVHSGVYSVVWRFRIHSRVAAHAGRWKMKTPLYGQGDAGLVWFRTIKNQLTGVQSFNQSDSDPSYFWKRT